MQFSGDDDDVGGEDDVGVPSDDFGVERACVTALAALAKASDKDSLGLLPSGNPVIMGHAGGSSVSSCVPATIILAHSLSCSPE